MLNSTITANGDLDVNMLVIHETNNVPTNWLIWFIPTMIIFIFCFAGMVYFWWRNRYSIGSSIATVQAELDAAVLMQEEYQYRFNGNSPTLNSLPVDIHHVSRDGIIDHNNDIHNPFTRIDPNTAYNHALDAAPAAPNDVVYRGGIGIDDGKDGFDAPNVEFIKRGHAMLCSGQYLYFTIEEGLNYGGQCDNTRCKAYGQPIYMQRGFGDIFPFTDVMEEVVVCSGCRAKFELEWFVLLRCDAKIEYQKVNSKCKTLDFCPRGDEYISLGENEDDDDEGSISTNGAMYEKLVFHVYPIETSEDLLDESCSY